MKKNIRYQAVMFKLKENQRRSAFGSCKIDTVSPESEQNREQGVMKFDSQIGCSSFSDKIDYSIKF